MFTKKVKYYENGKLIEKEVPLRGLELIEAKKEYLLEKVTKGEITDNEKKELLLYFGRDPEYIETIKNLSEEIKKNNEKIIELIESMKDVLSSLQSN